MLNIVIPMAGAGSRFVAAGFEVPKPLIPIRGVPMIRVVIENLRPTTPHRFIFVCQRDHVERYRLRELLREWAGPQTVIVQIDGLTDGAASTVLRASDLIDDDEPLMIANSDQYIDVSIDDYLAEMPRQSVNGLIMTMTAEDPKWSFVGLGLDNLVATVVEKQVISNEATVGIYNFSRGRDFVLAARTMIERDLRSNGEFYVAPVYNLLIEDGYRVGVHNVGSEAAGMYGLGIPSDLDLFHQLPVSDRAVEGLA